MNCHEVCAAIACASIHAFNGAPMMEPNGITCNALVATCDGVESIAIFLHFRLIPTRFTIRPFGVIPINVDAAKIYEFETT